MAKILQVSDDAGANYFILPGGTAELSRDASQIGDTIFGQTFQSNEVGLINWGLTGNAIWKGFAGYVADVKKQGTTTAFTTEAMTLVTGKRFRLDDRTKSIWDRAVTLVVFDNAIDHTADVQDVNWLFGEVTFKASYSVTEPVTVTGSFFPTSVLGKTQSFTLTQQAEAIRTTDFATAQANGGFDTFNPGLRTVQLEMSHFYALASAFAVDLQARSEVIVELDPAGDGLSIARGFFKITSHGQSGEVGALEEETLTLSLNVPESTPVAEFPYAWEHDTTSNLSVAVQKVLDAFQNETKLKAQYLPDGVTGDEGDVVVTEMSLSSGLDAMNEFAVSLQGDGVLTAI